jgi:hypothetical protein
MIAVAERQINAGRLEAMNEEDADLEEEDQQLNGLYNKYKAAGPRSN